MSTVSKVDRQDLPVIEVFDHAGAECPCCGACSWAIGPSLPAWPLLVTPQGAHLIECSVCKTAHLPAVEIPDYSDIAPTTFGEERTHKEKARLNFESVYALLGEHLPERDVRALVVGCSTGFEVEAILKSPFEFTAVEGIEPNIAAARLAQQRVAGDPRAKVRQGFAADIEGRYELITTTMVWEHIPSPFEALKHIARGQAEGGVLAIQVPRYDNLIPRSLRGRLWYYVMDAHLWYFTKQGMEIMLGRCGYDVVGVLNAPRYATLGFALDKIIRAGMRHLAPFFIRLFGKNKDPMKAWDELGELADRIERSIDRVSARLERMGLGLATKTFHLGFLNDAMTVVAVKRGS